MKTLHRLAILSLAGLLVLSGCGETTDNGGNNGDGAESSTIVIGAMGPLTGDAASYGLEMQRVIEMAVEDVNEAWAEEGMELVLQWEDAACNGKDASVAAQKLIDVDGVSLILGGFCSSETLAASAITEPAEVVLFSFGSSSPDVTDAGPYTFRNWPSDAFQGEILAELATNLGYETVGMITEQQDYTFGISSVFTEIFEANGGTVVEETFLSEDTDFKTQLTKLQNEEIDVLFINAQTPVKGDVILKQMTELGLETEIMLNDAVGANQDLLTDHAELLEGAYTATVSVDETNEELMTLMADYEAAHGENINYAAYSSAAYDSVWIVANALQEVGNDPRAIIEYFETMEPYGGLMGTLEFDENGDPLTGHTVFLIEGGKLIAQ